MTLSTRRGAGRRRGAVAFALLALRFGAADAALAQDNIQGEPPARANYPPGAVVQPLDESAGAALRGFMMRIADNPRDLDALVGAGGEAVRMGDAQAALGFFTRAQEIAPRDPRVVAGVASALVIAEQPRDALALFQQAVDLGADPATIAADRGLAYDMVGDNVRAIENYRLAQRANDIALVRRRLALALAIGGQRAEALRVIDADLRAHDRAAWRTQAFVLALTGDAAGAEDTARRVMPPGTAERMAPFFARLAALTPAQKAMAVHFGQFPAQNVALAANSPPPVAARPDRQAPAASRTPEQEEARFPTPISRYARPPERTLADVLRGQGENRQPAQAGAQVATASPPPRPLRRFEPPPAEEPAPGAVAGPPRPVQGAPTPASAPAAGATTTVPARAPTIDFAAIAETVRSLPPEVPLSPPPPRAAQDQPRPAPARETQPPAQRPQQQRQPQQQPPERPSRRAAATPRPPANPSRHWVQIATGPNRDALPREFARLRAKASAQLRGRQAWTTPLGRTNRLLVGPFATPAEAQALVNALGANDVGAIAWTSEAGQEIERLQTDEPRSQPASSRARGRSSTNQGSTSSRGRSRH